MSAIISKPVTRVLSTVTLLAAVLSSYATPASAQAYPSRLIKLIVPFPAGTATDTEARFLADKVGAALGQKIIVENKAGANGNLGATEAARAQPDGYTLYLATNSTHSANVHLYAKLPFDPVADFAPIARLAAGTLRALGVTTSVPGYRT
jgi:tripartite-type tricarboxylate transporter receptor subunit TctC